MKDNGTNAVSQLRAKMVEIVAELGPVEKKGRNVHFGYNYVSESQMMSELRGKLSKRGILFTTSVTSMQERERTNQKGNTEVLVSVTTEHKFVDAESEAEITVGGAGMGIDSGDKGVYKAITGATKYALMKNFMVSDEQDPEAGDADASREAKHTRTKAYELKKPNPADKADLKTLRAWLDETGITEAWVMGELREKGLAELNDEQLDQLKPGVVTRVLKSKGRLAEAFLAEKGGKKAAKKAPADDDDEIPMKHESDATRTREGDQTRDETRKSVGKGANVEQIVVDAGFNDWREVPIHWGKQKGELLGEITDQSLSWWINNWSPKPYKGKMSKADILLDAALCCASEELQEGGE
jgi:hypothetical protein